MITAYGTVESAVAAMRAGACDYLLKPVQFDDVLLKVRRALEYRRADPHPAGDDRAAGGREHLPQPGRADSRAMVRLFEMVRKLSTVKSNVLIVGESGTGKELFARAIHYNGITARQAVRARSTAGRSPRR